MSLLFNFNSSIEEDKGQTKHHYRMANIVDPDDTASHRPSHQDLPSLKGICFLTAK